MSFTDEQFNRAFAEFQEFGPRRRIPVEERWRDDLRDIDPGDFEALKARCQQIESFAVGLAERVRDGQMKDDAARHQLSETYPSLTRERLARTWSQAMYFSMK
jgi:hypothetical protein